MWGASMQSLLGARGLNLVAVLAVLVSGMTGITTSSKSTATLPWGPLHFPAGRQCPIVYPFSNETVFCNAVGRQRAVVSVDFNAGGAGGGDHRLQSMLVCVELEWRRRDNPLAVGVFVLDATNTFLPARIELNSTAVSGTVCFSVPPTPTAPMGTSTLNPSLFSVYYLPYAWSIEAWSGSFHSHFLARGSTPPVLPPDDAAGASLPATVLRWESFSEFDARSPMEWIASDAEVAAMLQKSGRTDFLTWVAQMHNTTAQTPRMPAVPRPLIESGSNTSAAVTMTPGGTTAVQVLLLAVAADITAVNVSVGAIGGIPTSAVSCVQTQGRDYYGSPLVPEPVHISRGSVGQLHVLIQLPATFGHCGTTQRGEIVVSPTGSGSATFQPTRITIAATVECGGATAAPDDNSRFWQLGTMAWLDSSLGIDDSVITRPYSPLSLDAATATISCRGRSVRVGTNGLPAEIVSSGRAVLSSPMAFTTVDQGYHDRVFPDDAASSPPRIALQHGGSTATWTTLVTVGGVQHVVEGSVDYSCYVNIGVVVTGPAIPLQVNNTALTIQLPASISRFASGAALGDDGALFPKGNASSLDWRWCVDGTSSPLCTGWRTWLGDVDAGIFVKLKGPEVAWNQATGGTSPPWSWSNGGLGGIRFRESSADSASTVTMEAFSGPRNISDGPIVYNFSLSITPVKGDYLHTAEGKVEHYHTRHFHVPYGQWDPPDPATLQKSLGITTIILHQSNSLNPYIDYPLHPAVTPRLKAYVEAAASVGVLVKLYFTLGQLSNHAVELFAFVGLNGEVFLQNSSDLPPDPGPSLQGMGGTLMGNEWLEEHMVTGYKGGWFTLNPGGEEDASISDNTTGRFMNYYVEGQQYLFNEVGIAGLYYDGFAAERFVQQRIRRMSQTDTPVARFDVHGRAMMYTEMLPFIDFMWTAEGIDFTRGPAYWLIAISALPFGTFGEMLGADEKPPTPGTSCGETCANRWRGMLFGMTNRAGWNGVDPNANRELWQLWDSFGIAEADMYGWWNTSAPVTTNNDHILATAYVRPRNGTTAPAVLIAIASWSVTHENITLNIDFARLGIASSGAQLLPPPSVPSFNRNQTTALDPHTPIPVSPLQGWLLVLE